MAVSMHYSGDIVPLLLVNASRFPHDTSSGEWKLMRAADSSGISYGIFREAGEHQPALKKSTVIAFSPSETLVGSCSRNIEAGTSVLQNHECASAAAASGNSPAIFINNSYSGKLALSFLSRKGRGYAGFMKGYADEHVPRHCSWNFLYEVHPSGMDCERVRNYAERCRRLY